MSRDPIGQWGDPAQRGNGQSYCSANPVNLVDPLGLWVPRGADPNDPGPKRNQAERGYDARWYGNGRTFLQALAKRFKVVLFHESSVANLDSGDYFTTPVTDRVESVLGTSLPGVSVEFRPHDPGNRSEPSAGFDAASNTMFVRLLVSGGNVGGAYGRTTDQTIEVFHGGAKERIRHETITVGHAQAWENTGWFDLVREQGFPGAEVHAEYRQLEREEYAELTREGSEFRIGIRNDVISGTVLHELWHVLNGNKGDWDDRSTPWKDSDTLGMLDHPSRSDNAPRPVAYSQQAIVEMCSHMNELQGQ